MANSVYERALTTTVIKLVSSLIGREGWMPQNQNTYRAYVMVDPFIQNIDEVYLASSIGGNNPG